MTSELLQLQETLHSTTQQHVQRQRCIEQNQVEALHQQKVDQLLSRIEKLRRLAKAQGKTRQYKAKEQTSFCF